MDESRLIHIDQIKNLRLTNMCIVLEKLRSEWEKEKRQHIDIDQESDEEEEGEGKVNASFPVKTD